MKFEDYRFAPEIKQNLAQLGYKKPTDIQYKSIGPILKGEDVLAIAQTGTGKTAAFAIPIIQRIHERYKNRRSSDVKCVVMAPTRELALQLTEVFRSIAKHTSVRVLCVYGGVEQDQQIAQLTKGVDIVVATPGRLFDLSSQGHLGLKSVEIVVLDEADHMLDLGFIKDIRDLAARLPKQRQTLFFSATINEQIKKIAYSLVRNPIRIQISPKNPVARNITHSVVMIEMDEKRYFLERIVREHPEQKILVFVRTKIRAERILAALERVEIQALSLHGDKVQDERQQVLASFRKGEVYVLVATDVSARGIDIANVDYVVNYDMPEQPENYVHRVGRTGRGVHKGQAVSFCSPNELPLLEAIEAYIGDPIDRIALSKEEYSDTLDFTSEKKYDLKALLKEGEELEKRKKKKGKK
jgi:ATP-dependent RNA helicase RhlE